MMMHNFSNKNVDAPAARQTKCKGGASGISSETVHRIRHQGRIERAKVIRQGIELLKRIITRSESKQFSDRKERAR